MPSIIVLAITFLGLYAYSIYNHSFTTLILCSLRTPISSIITDSILFLIIIYIANFIEPFHMQYIHFYNRKYAFAPLSSCIWLLFRDSIPQILASKFKRKAV